MKWEIYLKMAVKATGSVQLRNSYCTFQSQVAIRVLNTISHYCAKITREVLLYMTGMQKSMQLIQHAEVYNIQGYS